MAFSRAELNHHEIGGSGPILLMLHGNGFHARVFTPMVSILGSHFRCIALDLPGHGESDSVKMPLDFTPHDLAEVVAMKIESLGLHGCYCLGHSLGSSLALLVEAGRPGTFAAIYCWEPPISTLGTSEAPSVVLQEMALKRRTSFPSEQTTLDLLSAKQPYKAWDKECMRLYVKHGVKPVPDGGVALRCTSAVEASVYRSMEPPPPLDSARVRCRVMVALGKSGSGLHSRLIPEGVALHAKLPNSELARFGELSHHGPMEQPLKVARHALSFFSKSFATSRL